MDSVISMLKLDGDAFSELGQDESLTPYAAMIVVLVGLSSGVEQFLQQGSPLVLLTQVVLTLVGWGVGTVSIWGVGKLFGGSAELGEILRILGLTQIPLLLIGLMFIPVAGIWVALLACLYSLVLLFLGIRENHVIGNMATVGTMVLSLIPSVVVLSVLMLFLLPMLLLTALF